MSNPTAAETARAMTFDEWKQTTRGRMSVGMVRTGDSTCLKVCWEDAQTQLTAAHAQGRAEGAAVVDIPCSVCGGPCVEFTVPNDVWNLVVRKGGPETDKEYLCEACYRNFVTDYIRALAAVDALNIGGGE